MELWRSRRQGMVHAQYPRPAALRRNPRWPDQRPVHQARIASRREKESRRILDTDRSSFGYLFFKGSGIKASPIDRIPLFDWARKNESSIWIALADAYKNKSTLPAAPYPEDGQWAPSGMEDLDDAFRWAIQISPRPERDYWQFHYGTWLAGRERVEEAIEQLSIPDIDLAKALLAGYMFVGRRGKRREILTPLSPRPRG